MTDLSEQFERLGLSQYLEIFITEGFDTWDTVLDITESDLTYLNVKLGHRRKLQRAIADARGQPPDRALPGETRRAGSANDGGYRSDESGVEQPEPTSRQSAGSTVGATQATTGTKRKYRRHPKPDSHAPERPPSAYVIFSNQVREELKGQELTFTEIAKVVGERWQVLSSDIREVCEQQANSAKEKYYAELANYKKTTQYQQYQEYLTDFKAKHGQSRTEGKRSKLEAEASSASMPPTTNRLDPSERAGGSRSAPTLAGGAGLATENIPPGLSALSGHSVFQRPPSSSSPALYSEPVNSPIKQELYSPGAASPSSALYGAKDSRTPARLTPESRPRDAQSQNHWQNSNQHYRPIEAWPAAGPVPPGHHTTLPRRISRDSRESAPVPPLLHRDSTLSSADSIPPYPMATGPLLPISDAQKAGRILPHPVLSAAAGTGTSPHEHRLNTQLVNTSLSNTLPAASGAQTTESPRTSNWPALLRATELAREADMKDIHPELASEDPP